MKKIITTMKIQQRLQEWNNEKTEEVANSPQTLQIKRAAGPLMKYGTQSPGHQACTLSGPRRPGPRGRGLLSSGFPEQPPPCLPTLGFPHYRAATVTWDRSEEVRPWSTQNARTVLSERHSVPRLRKTARQDLPATRLLYARTGTGQQGPRASINRPAQARPARAVRGAPTLGVRRRRTGQRAWGAQQPRGRRAVRGLNSTEQRGRTPRLAWRESPTHTGMRSMLQARSSKPAWEPVGAGKGGDWKRPRGGSREGHILFLGVLATWVYSGCENPLSCAI